MPSTSSAGSGLARRPILSPIETPMRRSPTSSPSNTLLFVIRYAKFNVNFLRIIRCLSHPEWRKLDVDTVHIGNLIGNSLDLAVALAFQLLGQIVGIDLGADVADRAQPDAVRAVVELLEIAKAERVVAVAEDALIGLGVEG